MLLILPYTFAFVSKDKVSNGADGMPERKAMQNMAVQGQTMVMLPQCVWEQFMGQVQRLDERLQEMQNGSFQNKWIESEDARKQLSVSSRTWQAMRDKRQIPFSQFGRKIYVRQSDLDAFMMANYVEAR
jgi:hypothetical protein